MPERFYDPEFTARVVRLLQLKGGRAPSEVADEIVPVLDLSSLFSRADEELPDSLLGAVYSRAVEGQTFARFYGPNTAPVAGNVHVSQFFNPLGSSRLVLIHHIMHFGAATGRLSGRFYNTPLAALSTFALPLNSRPSRNAGVLEFRTQSLAQAGFPPAGMSRVFAYHDARSAFNLLTNMPPVVLQPGEGFVVHSSGVPGAIDTDPLPDVGVIAVQMAHYEITIA